MPGITEEIRSKLEMSQVNESLSRSESDEEKARRKALEKTYLMSPISSVLPQKNRRSYDSVVVFADENSDPNKAPSFKVFLQREKIVGFISYQKGSPIMTVFDASTCNDPPSTIVYLASPEQYVYIQPKATQPTHNGRNEERPEAAVARPIH